MKMVVANWKMNMTRKDALAFCQAVQAGYKAAPGVVAAIAPPYTLLTTLTAELGDLMPVYAQNGHAEPTGAFTGEIPMGQVKDTGAAGVLLGHSERRQYNGE